MDHTTQTKRGATIATLVILAALGGWIIRRSIDLQLFNALGVGPGLFPFVSGVLIVVLSLIRAMVELGHLLRHYPVRQRRQFPVTARLDGQREFDPDEGSRSAEEHHVGHEAEEMQRSGVRWSRFWGAVACVVAYVVVLGHLGFALSITLLAFGLLTLIARRPVLFSAIVAVCTGLVVWAGFVELLGIRFPPPSIPFLAALFL